MDLLRNAVESIQVGVEDYEVATHPRLLSAVRNIHAGVVLLYKEALRRRSLEGSNDVLVMADLIPRETDSGEIQFIGVGKKTVNVQQIKKRFASLKIQTDWERFDAISNVRNDVEHRYTTTNKKNLQGVVSNACMIVRSFIATELQGDPLTLLGERTWKVMLGIKDIYEVERKECREALQATNGPPLLQSIHRLACAQCGSELLAPSQQNENHAEVTLRCRACGAEGLATECIARAFSESHIDLDAYLDDFDLQLAVAAKTAETAIKQAALALRDQIQPAVEQALAVRDEIQPTIEQALAVRDEIQPTIEQALAVRAEIQPIIEQTLAVRAEIQPTIEQALAVRAEIQPIIEHTLAVRAEIQPTIEQALAVRDEILKKFRL